MILFYSRRNLNLLNCSSHEHEITCDLDFSLDKEFLLIRGKKQSVAYEKRFEILNKFNDAASIDVREASVGAS